MAQPHDETDRYHRQRILPGFGAVAQERLRASHAVVVGCGALGCAAIDLLARAGVGTLTLVDRDTVELTNLQRQSLFTEEDARTHAPKAEAARRRVAAVNSQVRVHACVEHLCAENARELVRGAQVIVDGLDNYRTRYLLNELAVREGIAYIHAGAVATRGTGMPVLAGVAAAAGIAREDAPCLRCLFPEIPPPGAGETCDTAGVFGPAVTIVGARAAGEALKVLIGDLDAVDRSLWAYDAWTGRATRTPLAGAARADCECCGRRRFELLDAADEDECAVLCGRNAVQVRPTVAARVDLEALARKLRVHGEFAVRDGVLAGAVPGGFELSVFADGRVIVRGTVEPDVARGVYDRFVGR
ncbi:MAG: ThiF family adenylyltransferase [Phycisphaerales bacterium]